MILKQYTIFKVEDRSGKLLEIYNTTDKEAALNYFTVEDFSAYWVLIEEGIDSRMVPYGEFKETLG